MLFYDTENVFVIINVLYFIKLILTFNFSDYFAL